jgi:hypothetical protein
MRKLSHNKKRNLGLVYEFLTREVSSSVVNGDRKRAADALGIISTHLAEGTALHEELSLHRSVMESRGVSEKLARRIVDELKSAGLRLAARSVIREKAKAELIHEMNRTLGRDVFDRYRIPEYTAHASVNILMSRGLNARLDESVEVARVEEHLVEFLSNKPAEAPRYDADATMFAYKTAVGLFEKEIGRDLDKPQAELLREFVRVELGGNPAPFKRTFDKQKADLASRLKAARIDEAFQADADMTSRLNEAIADMSGLSADSGEAAVEALMLYHNLRREIES